MIQAFNSRYLTPTKYLRNLSVMMCIHNDSTVSQNDIAGQTALSSSMVNNYIKKLKQEKLIIISGKTNRTQTYHLTLSGIKYLRQNLLEYSANVVQVYSEVKREITKIINNFCKEGVKTAVLFGVAETAEIVFAAIQNTTLKVVDVVDSDVAKQGKRFNSHIIKSPEHLKMIRPDAVIITSFGKQEEIYRNLRGIIGDGIKIIKLSDA